MSEQLAVLSQHIRKLEDELMELDERRGFLAGLGSGEGVTGLLAHLDGEIHRMRTALQEVEQQRADAKTAEIERLRAELEEVRAGDKKASGVVKRTRTRRDRLRKEADELDTELLRIRSQRGRFTDRREHLKEQLARLGGAM